MTKRVIARLFGGLGNQLFIYAAARALAEKKESTLLLDIESGFKNDLFERQFALHHFNINYEEAKGIWAFQIPIGRELRYLSRNINRLIAPYFQFYYSDFWQTPQRFMPEIYQSSIFHVVWMEGYWQSPAYFESIRHILRAEIQVKTPISQQSIDLSNSVKKSNSVCVHLRMLRNYIKGVEISDQNKMNIQHYLKCMDYIAQQIKNPHFFCFSDNPDAMESIVKTHHNVTFITHNKGDELAHEDFYLMSQCKHFILSNSTFGWWPAWLVNDPESIIITPPINYWDNTDILPEYWLTSDHLSTFY